MQKICSQDHGTKVSVGDVVQTLGPRSFAPIILAIGLVAITPIDSIPTVSTTFGVIIFLTALQMLAGRRALWLPGFVSRRAMNTDRLISALAWLLPKARWADRWLGVRLVTFTHGFFLVLIAVCCTVLGALMPMLEFMPLVPTLPALAFTAFGVALLHDGVAALLGFALTAVTLLLIFELVRLPF